MATPPLEGLISSHYKDQGKVDFAYLEGTDYVLFDCTDCGLVYQGNAPNNTMLNIIYNEMINPAFLWQLEEDHLSLNNFERVASELLVLFRYLDKKPHEVRFFDFGFGYGRWTRVAAEIGAKVFVTEISPEKVAFAKKLGAEIVVDDALSEMQFDFIHTEQVFEHLTEPARDFRRLANSLAPGGIMKVAVPKEGNIRNLLAKKGMIDQSPQVAIGRRRPLGTERASKKITFLSCHWST